MNSLKTLSALFVLLFAAVANAVSNVKISELPTATTITTNDLTVLVSNGSTRKASLGSVLDTLRPVGAFVATTDETAVGISASGYNNGAALGYAAIGYNSGAALGYSANGSDIGAAVGNNANGSGIGAAVGYNANGSGYGAAVGNSADGSGSGAALGDSAKGYYLGAAVGMSANGTNYGVAVGRGADGHGVGNVAIGGNDAGTNNARVPHGFTDTVELGRGTATTDGGLHFRGRLIVDSNYVHYGNGSGLTNLQSTNIVGNSLVIGSGSSASANSSVTGGATNTASGSYSFIGGGYSNSASALGSVVIGGSENVASGKYSSAVGLRAKATRQGELAHASGGFGTAPQIPAQAQRSSFILRGNTATTQTRKLTLDGSTTSTSENTLVLPADTTWQFDIRVAAYNDSTTDLGGGWHIRGAIKRAGDVTTILGTTSSLRFSETSFGGPQIYVVADDTTEELTITVDAAGIVTPIRWVAAVDIVQVSFGTP